MPVMWTADDQREYNVAYYAEHRDEEIERVRVRQASTLEFLRDLRRRPCADCGQILRPGSWTSIIGTLGRSHSPSRPATHCSSLGTSCSQRLRSATSSVRTATRFGPTA